MYVNERTFAFSLLLEYPLSLITLEAAFSFESTGEFHSSSDASFTLLSCDDNNNGLQKFQWKIFTLWENNFDE